MNSASSTGDRSLRLQCACTLLVAIGAAYISYRHGRDFALRYGADGTTATLWPLIVDGLLTMATIELWKAGHHHHATGKWKAWLSFTLGIGLSLCANIASAPELDAFSISVAACPPLALLLSVELLNQALKRHRAEQTNTTVHEPDGIDQTAGPSEQAVEPPALSTIPKSASIQSANSAAANLEPSHTAFDDSLFQEARQLDAEHWDRHQRPISAESLRRKLRIGSKRARTLTHLIREQHQIIGR